jgi:DNA-binding response OmpR family regulator
MTRVLLFDPDLNHAEGITRSLQTSTCEVLVRCDLASTLRALRRDAFDILILASGGGQEWKRSIAPIQEMLGHKPSSPQIIWLSRTYRGPQEKLELERKGVRLVYER